MVITLEVISVHHNDFPEQIFAIKHFIQKENDKVNISQKFVISFFSQDQQLEAWAAEQKKYFSAYKTAGSKIHDEICKILEAHSRYKISRKIIAGSIGKNASLGLKNQPDFDIVVFINKILPPYEHVVEEFREILQKYTTDLLCQMTVQTTSRSIQFSVDTVLDIGYYVQKTRIDFDLLPAPNPVSGRTKHVEKSKRKLL